MKKALWIFLGSFSCLLFCISEIWSAPITPQTAEQIALEQLGLPKPTRSGGRLALLYTSSGRPTRSESGNQDFYVFGNRDGAGYVVVAGDDIVPPVLGYSLTGSFPTNDLPPELQSWLASYAQWVRSARATKTVQQGLVREPNLVVTPLLKGLIWDQDAPYNLQTPIIGGKHAPTGCVATAVAQIMRYFCWPLQAKGVVQNLPDFGQEPYDWKHMPNICRTDAAQEVCNAVSRLMRDVGYACNMKYGADESGAYAYDAYLALINHFDYAPSLRFVEQKYYTWADWQKLLISELRAARPIYYGGTSGPGVQGGHAFVCDGYDGNGYFHFNFGWSGLANGYYLITNILPTSFGIGAGASGGYTYQADAIIGFTAKPHYQGDTEVGNYNYSNIRINDTEKGETDKTSPLHPNLVNLGNKNAMPILSAAAFAVIDAKGKEVVKNFSTDQRPISQNDIIAMSDVTLNLAKLNNGKYTLRPLAYQVNAQRYIPVVRNQLESLNVIEIEIRGDKKIVSVTPGAPKLEVEWKTSELTQWVKQYVTLTVRNVGNSGYYARFQVRIGKTEIPNGSEDMIINEFLSLGAGDEKTLQLLVSGPSSDEERYLHFYYNKENNYAVSDCTDKFGGTQITSKPSYVLGNCQFEILEKSTSVKQGDRFLVRFRAQAEANKGVVLKLENYVSYNSYKGYWSPNIPVVLRPGESREFVVEKTLAYPAGEYTFVTLANGRRVPALSFRFKLEKATETELDVPDYNTPLTQYSIAEPVLSPTEGGTCSITLENGDPLPANRQVAAGTQIQIKASANAGWEVDNKNVQGAEPTMGDLYRVKDNVQITITFKQATPPVESYTLQKIEIEGEGSVKVLCQNHQIKKGETIERGKTVMVVATPKAPEWEILVKNIAVTPATGPTNSSWTPTGDFTVKVTFTKKAPPVKTYTYLALHVEGDGKVEVLCNEKAVAVNETITQGDKIKIVCQPKDGWEALPANLRVTGANKLAGTDYEYLPNKDFTVTMRFLKKVPDPQPQPQPNPAPNPDTAVENPLFAHIVVSPNPFSSQLKVKNEEAVNARYELINNYGVVVRAGALEGIETVLSTEKLVSGLYLLRISTTTATKTYRLVK